MNYFKKIFDDLFPLKDSPKRAMDAIYQKNCVFAEVITEIWTGDKQTQKTLSYLFNELIDDYYSDGVNHFLSKININPSSVNEQTLLNVQDLIFNDAMRYSLSENNFFILAENHNELLIEEIAVLLDFYEISVDEVIDEDIQDNLNSISEAKLLSIIKKSLEPKQLKLIALSYEENFLISIIPEEKSELLERISNEFHIDFSIEPFLNPYFRQSDHHNSNHNNHTSNSNGASINDSENDLNTGNFFNTNTNFDIGKITFFQHILPALENTILRLGVSLSDEAILKSYFDEHKAQYAETIETAFIRFLIAEFGDLNKISNHQLTPMLIEQFKADIQLQFELGQMMRFVPFSMPIDLTDIETLIDFVGDRLLENNINLSTSLENIIEDEDIDFFQALNEMNHLLSSVNLILISFWTGEDDNIYFLVQKSEYANIAQYAKEAHLLQNA